MGSRHAAAALFLLLCGLAMAGPDAERAAVAQAPPASGTPAEKHPADFTLPSLDGRPVALNQFLGKKPVLLVFWTTWCPECREAIPSLNALHTGPLGDKLQILALDYLESREKVSAVVKARNILYPVLLDERGKVTRAYGVLGIPTYVLINRKGEAVYRDNVLPGDISRYL
jgi:peroxiredoxin